MESLNQQENLSITDIIEVSDFQELKNLENEYSENMLIQNLWSNILQVNFYNSKIFFVQNEWILSVVWNNLKEIKSSEISEIYPKENIVKLPVKDKYWKSDDFFFYDKSWSIKPLNWNFISAGWYFYNWDFKDTDNKKLYDSEFNLIWNWFDEKKLFKVLN